MVRFLWRTRGNANPKGKSKVYFACHPEDFGKYFNKICADVFKTHDCAIFYKEDMQAAIAREDMAIDLGSQNVFIVPVTFRLLTQPNQAMDVEIPYAMENGIPILPLLMESGLDEFYEKKFGKRQNLNPYIVDETKISYEEKLKRFLESVLIGDALADRIRAEFDGYIFLSYRKKDRRYANELMKLIHSHRECRDVAIWYDEFLTLGESFEDNINKMLDKSKLFALLVTPNVLEEPNGKPNFVMGREYPAALEAGKVILPAEMEWTDRVALAEKFQGIPLCVDPHNRKFKETILEAVRKIATDENDQNPTHNYLIGLAYLNGIDMETDRDRGMALITAAAESGQPEAMEKLFRVYEGRGAYREAAEWADRLVKHYQKLYGPEHSLAVEWQEELAVAYGNAGDYRESRKLLEQVYDARLRLLGEKHPDTLGTLNNLAWICNALGEGAKAVEFGEKAYALRLEKLGREHPGTLRAMSNLAKAYCGAGDFKTAETLCKSAYEIRLRLLGEEHPETLVSMNDLAVIYGDLDKHAMAKELQVKAYALRCKVSGEEHPETLTVLHNLALSCGAMGDLAEALALSEKAYALRCKVLGEEHPDTIGTLNNLAWAHSDLGNGETAVQLCEKAYTLADRILGEAHPYTRAMLETLAEMYRKAERYTQAKARSQIKAVMMGGAVADALGVPVEFKSREEIAQNPVTDMRGFGTHGVPAGTWSDDTSMSLCALAELSRENWTFAGVMDNFCAWVSESQFTATGKFFDIGVACHTAVRNYRDRGMGVDACGLDDEYSNGNGSLMRIHPFVLLARYNREEYARWEELIDRASALTHAHSRSKLACRIYAMVLFALLEEPAKAGVCAALQQAEERYRHHPEYAHFARLFSADFGKLALEEIKSSGYVVDTLEAAVWCLLNTDSYQACVLAAVNLGEDTDTVAAVAGTLAGALYGYDSIPEAWRDTLKRRDYIEQLCEAFATAWGL